MIHGWVDGRLLAFVAGEARDGGHRRRGANAITRGYADKSSRANRSERDRERERKSSAVLRNRVTLGSSPGHRYCPPSPPTLRSEVHQKARVFLESPVIRPTHFHANCARSNLILLRAINMSSSPKNIGYFLHRILNAQRCRCMILIQVANWRH